MGSIAQWDIKDYTSTVLFYINNCVDCVTVDKHIMSFPNNKLWMTRDVKPRLERDPAFRSGNSDLYSTARSNLKEAIRGAKADYRQKMEGHFSDGDSRQGILPLIKHKGSKNLSSSDSLVEELNLFFARFEGDNAETGSMLLPSPDSQTITISTDDVRRVLRGVNPRKAAGPDDIPGRALRHCADQLAEVFSKIFNLSLSTRTVPECLKSATLCPYLRKHPSADRSLLPPRS